MESNFKELVTTLNISPLSNNTLHQLTLLLQNEDEKPFDSLLMLEEWAWKLLSENSSQWINESYYQKLFYTLALFNKNLIFNCDDIEADSKAILLFSVNIDQINNIFKQIDRSNDDNDPFIIIISLWFDIHSYFIHDNPHCSPLPITDYINQYIMHNYVMNEQFKFYLHQLLQSELSESIFTAKMLFYIKTCLFSLFSYMGIKTNNLLFTADEMLRYIENDYLHIIHIHSRTVSLWSKELLTCMAQLMSFIGGLHWRGGQKRTDQKILFLTEQMMCEHVENLIRIISHRPFYEEIKAVRSNDETILIDATLLNIMNIIQTQNINWFFRSNTIIQNALLTVAEMSPFNEICLYVYAILGAVLTDEQLRHLKIVDTISGFFFNMVELAWNHSSKQYKRIPLEHLLQGFLNLSKNDLIQQKTADLNKVPLLIDMSDQYLIIYDIFWTLSFNQNIQQQLRSNTSFISKLYQLSQEYNNEQMGKIIDGILWNLEINREDRSIIEINDENTFNIMISYSHKDKILCKQIYDELIKMGYHVWIDFNQMHGNMMDAMSQGIERSQIIIICMSEEYRKSNYCRAEAQYAFQRQRQIVPILLQKHYKPDGWLLFLTSQLLYVDFTKHEFNRAMKMLLIELKATGIFETNVPLVPTVQDTNTVLLTASILPPKTLSSSIHSKTILEWTQAYVHDWLIEHHLIQMSRLLRHCDGRSLVYLNKYMRHGESQQVLKSLQEDSIRQIGQTLSLLELSCLQSLIDQEIKVIRSKMST